MINIYHAPLTRSVRVLWLCEELGLEYEVTPVDFSPEYRATPEWRRMNPVGKVPVMTDGELKLFESGAMLQHLLTRYGNGRLQPASGTDAYGLFLQWCWFAEATFARPVGEIVNHRRAFPKESQRPEVIEEMRARTQLCCDALEDELADRTYIVGNTFTAADIMLGYTMLLCERLAVTQFGPATDAYWQRLNSRPAFQSATADL